MPCHGGQFAAEQIHILQKLAGCYVTQFGCAVASNRNDALPIDAEDGAENPVFMVADFCNSLPDAESIRRTVLSAPPTAITFPSGEIDAPKTVSLVDMTDRLSFPMQRPNLHFAEARGSPAGRDDESAIG